MNNNSVRIMWGHTSLGVILALFFFIIFLLMNVQSWPCNSGFVIEPAFGGKRPHDLDKIPQCLICTQD